MHTCHRPCSTTLADSVCHSTKLKHTYGMCRVLPTVEHIFHAAHADCAHEHPKPHDDVFNECCTTADNALVCGICDWLYLVNWQQALWIWFCGTQITKLLLCPCHILSSSISTCTTRTKTARKVQCMVLLKTVCARWCLQASQLRAVQQSKYSIFISDNNTTLFIFNSNGVFPNIWSYERNFIFANFVFLLRPFWDKSGSVRYKV